MSKIETAVAEHYSDSDLLSRIITGLKAAGANLDNLQVDDLSAVEEFHIGGREATVQIVEKMSLTRNQYILDIGCGIGGAARYIAGRSGCNVEGIDLTPEYIDIARTLTELTGLKEKINFNVASALSMPFENKTFDAAITLHVAMNISDRSALYSEISRVLKPGAALYIFDVMKKNDEDPVFPVPWAETEETSHLTTPDEMRLLLENAGFNITQVSDRTDFALDFFKKSMDASRNSTALPGIQTVMGEGATEKLKNVMNNIKNGRISPVQMIATRTLD